MSILNSNTLTGGAGEELAREYLVERGFLFIEANFNTHYGEIDLIMKKGKTIYFIEVKTRNSVQFGYPESSVTKEKLQKMKRTIGSYVQNRIIYSRFEKQILIIAILYKTAHDHPEISMFEIE